MSIFDNPEIDSAIKQVQSTAQHKLREFDSQKKARYKVHPDKAAEFLGDPKTTSYMADEAAQDWLNTYKVTSESGNTTPKGLNNRLQLALREHKKWSTTNSTTPLANSKEIRHNRRMENISGNLDNWGDLFSEDGFDREMERRGLSESYNELLDRGVDKAQVQSSLRRKLFTKDLAGKKDELAQARVSQHILGLEDQSDEAYLAGAQSWVEGKRQHRDEMTGARRAAADAFFSRGVAVDWGLEAQKKISPAAAEAYQKAKHGFKKQYGDILPVVRGLVDNAKAQGERGLFETTEEVDVNWGKIMELYGDDRRDEFLYVLGRISEEESVNVEGFLTRNAKGVSRTVEGMAKAGMRLIDQVKTEAAGGSKEASRDRDWNQFQSDIANLKENVATIEASNDFEKIANFTTASLPYMVFAATGVGTGLIAATEAQPMAERMREANPNLTYAEAMTVALPAGAVYAGIEKLQVGGLFGKFPGMQKVMNKFTSGTSLGAWSRRVAATTAYEYGQETLQDAVEPLARDIANQFKAEVPEGDWSTFEVVNYDRFLGVIGLSVLGGTGQWARDRFTQQEVKSELQDKFSLRLTGATREEADKISEMAEKDPDAALQEYKKTVFSKSVEERKEVSEAAIKESKDAVATGVLDGLPTVTSNDDGGFVVDFKDGTKKIVDSREAAQTVIDQRVEEDFVDAAQAVRDRMDNLLETSEGDNEAEIEKPRTFQELADLGVETVEKLKEAVAVSYMQRGEAAPENIDLNNYTEQGSVTLRRKMAGFAVRLAKDKMTLPTTVDEEFSEGFLRMLVEKGETSFKEVKAMLDEFGSIAGIDMTQGADVDLNRAVIEGFSKFAKAYMLQGDHKSIPKSSQAWYRKVWRVLENPDSVPAPLRAFAELVTKLLRSVFDVAQAIRSQKQDGKGINPELESLAMRALGLNEQQIAEEAQAKATKEIQEEFGLDPEVDAKFEDALKRADQGFVWYTHDQIKRVLREGKKEQAETLLSRLEIGITQSRTEALSKKARKQLREARQAVAEAKSDTASPSFSITPAQDAEYLELAKNPEENAGALQKLVDGAARAAGYLVGPVYHGSKSSDIKAFDPGKHSFPNSLDAIGTWFTTEESQTKRYAFDATTYRQALKMDNPLTFELNNVIPEVQAGQLRKLATRRAMLEDNSEGYSDLSFQEQKESRKFAGEISKQIDDIDAQTRENEPFYALVDTWRKFHGGEQFGDPRKFVNHLKSKGYDGVHLKNTLADFGREGSEYADWYIAFDSSQSKSTDPVTRDADGNVIPLSQRFDESRDEISFSITPAQDAEYMELAKDPEKNWLELDTMVARLAKALGYETRTRHATGATFDAFDRGEIPEFDPDTNIRGFHVSNEADTFSSHKYQSSSNKVLNLFVKKGRIVDRVTAQQMVARGEETDGFPSGFDTVVFSEPAGFPTQKQQRDFDQGEPVSLDGPNERYGYFVIKGSPMRMEIQGRMVDVGGGAELYLGNNPNETITTFEDLDDAFDFRTEEHLVMRSPEQLKSADPVTKDADGNVIPLSQRFDQSRDEISFSITPKEIREAKEPIVKQIYLKETEKFKQGVESGRIKTDSDIRDFIGKHMVMHQPDTAMAGEVRVDGESFVKGKGGVYYPVLFSEEGYFWASTAAKADEMAGALNEISERNGGSIYMALTSADVDKLFSSTTMSVGTMNFFKQLATNPRRYGITEAQLNKMLIEASKTQIVSKLLIKGKDGKPVLNEKGEKTYKVKTQEFGHTLSKGSKLNQTMQELEGWLQPFSEDKSTGSSFDVRKSFVFDLMRQVSTHLKGKPAQSKAVASLLTQESNEFAKNKVIKGDLSLAAFTQGLGDMLSEPLTKTFQQFGNKGKGYIYAVIEIEGKVKAIDTKGHESYPKAIVSAEGKLPTVHVMKDGYHWTDVVQEKDSGARVERVTKEMNKVYPTGGFSAYKGRPLQFGDVQEKAEGVELSFSITPKDEQMSEAVERLFAGPKGLVDTGRKLRSKLSKIREKFEANLVNAEERDKDTRELETLNSLMQLNALRSVMPKEVRDSVGSPLDLVKLKTAKPRERNVIRRLEKMEKALNKYHQRELREKIEKGLKKSKFKVSGSRKREGKIGELGHEVVEHITSAKTQSLQAAEATKADLTQTFEEIETPTSEEFERWDSLTLATDLFYDYENATTARLEQALDFVTTNYKEGRREWLAELERRRAERDQFVREAISFMGDKDLSEIGEIEASTIATNKSRGAFNKFNEGVAEFLFSNHHTLARIVENAKDKEAAKDWYNRLLDSRIQGDLKSEQEANQKQEDFNEKLREIVGSKEKLVDHQVNKFLYDAKQARINKITTHEGAKDEEVSVPKDVVESILRGEVSGFDGEALSDTDIESLREAMAKFDKLSKKEQGEQRSIKFTRVISEGERKPVGKISHEEALQWWLTMRQPDQREKLENMGWDERMMEELSDFIPDNIKEMGLWMSNNLVREGTEISDIHAKEYGVGLNTGENYFPVQNKTYDSKAEIDLNDPGAGRGISTASLKERVVNKALPAQVGAFGTYLRHVTEMAYWKHNVSWVRQYGGAFKTKEFARNMEGRVGVSAYKTLSKYMESVSNKGAAAGQEMMGSERFLKGMMSRAALAILGGRLSTIWVNSTAFINALGSSDVSATQVLRHSLGALIDGKGAMKETWHNELAVLRRDQGSSFLAQQAMKTGSSGHWLIRDSEKVAQLGMVPMNVMDVATNTATMVGIYRATEKAALKRGADPDVAKAEADTAVTRAHATLAQPALGVSKSLLEQKSASNPAMGMLIFFMSEVRKNAANNYVAWRTLLTGKGIVSRTTAARQAAVYTFVYTAIVQGFRAIYNMLTGDEEKDEEVMEQMRDPKFWMYAAASDNLAAIPIGGEIVTSLLAKPLDQKYWDSQSTFMGAAKQLSQASTIFDEDETDSARIDEAIDFIQSTGSLLPGGPLFAQAGNVADFAKKVAEGGLGYSFSEADRVTKIRKGIERNKKAIFAENEDRDTRWELLEDIANQYKQENPDVWDKVMPVLTEKEILPRKIIKKFQR